MYHKTKQVKPLIGFELNYRKGIKYQKGGLLLMTSGFPCFELTMTNPTKKPTSFSDY